MHYRFRVLILSGAAVLLPALFVAGPVSSAPHDGPGPGCVTHVGLTYISGGRVYSEGSGGCNASAIPLVKHVVFHEIQWTRFWGWTVIGTHKQGGMDAPFSVWLPLDRATNCPRNYRGHVVHTVSGGDDKFKDRYTNEISC